MNTASQQAASAWGEAVGADETHQGFFKLVGRTVKKAKWHGVPLEQASYTRFWRPDEVAAEVRARWTARKLARTTAAAGGTSARGRL